MTQIGDTATERLAILKGLKESYALTIGVAAVTWICLAGAEVAAAGCGSIGLMVTALLGMKGIVDREKAKPPNGGEGRVAGPVAHARDRSAVTTNGGERSGRV